MSGGLAQIWVDQAPMVTFEGVNTVMLQQSSRYIFKQVKKVQNGKKATRYFSYINDLDALSNSQSGATNLQDFLDVDHLIQALRVRSAYCLKQVTTALNSSKASSKEKANDIFALDVERSARHHLIYINALMVKNSLLSMNSTFKNKNNVPIMLIILRVYCLKEIMKDTSSLYEAGFFRAGSGQLLDDAFKQALKDLRPHMIPMVEVMHEGSFTPWGSTIGNPYGDIYEKQLETMMNSKLNTGKVPPYYESLMKPVMQKFKL